MPKNNTIGNYKDLGTAIVNQAVDDYIWALNVLKKKPQNIIEEITLLKSELINLRNKKRDIVPELLKNHTPAEYEVIQCKIKKLNTRIEFITDILKKNNKTLKAIKFKIEIEIFIKSEWFSEICDTPPGKLLDMICAYSECNEKTQKPKIASKFTKCNRA